ncbi:MAG: M20/M25/M40 family metallo-hydrolase, partial [Chloroflexi bacterium]|nr:M20/M25/M40 family metallo-hydrolase [Chloroflexota bacterium]
MMQDRDVMMERERRMVGEIYTSDAAYRHLLALCDDCGHRFTGSPGEARAVSFVLERMRAYGLGNVRTEEVPLTGWKRGDARLEVLDRDGLHLETLALPYSPAGRVEAELLDLESAVPEAISARADEIKGKIVLVSSANPPMYRRPVHRMEKYSRVVQAGAVGFVFVGDEPGQLIQTGSLPAGASIPGVGVSRETGAAIRRALKSGPMRVRLTVGGEAHPVVAHNAVGEIPGERPGPWLIVGAHLDSHDISPGADDNASGVAAVLEAARVLAMEGPLPLPVRVIFFTGEELGLLGAYQYVDAHQAELADVRFVLNLDTVGGRGQLAVLLQGWPELLPRLRAQVQEVNPEGMVADRLVPYSDHFPFAVQGIPSAAVAVWRGGGGGRGWGHTTADTVDKVSPASLQAA